MFVVGKLGLVNIPQEFRIERGFYSCYSFLCLLSEVLLMFPRMCGSGGLALLRQLLVFVVGKLGLVNVPQIFRVEGGW